MYRYCLTFFAMLLTVAIVACGDGHNADDAIGQAEQAMADDDFGHAQLICDSIINGNGMQNLDARDLCRTSLVYMKLAEVREEEFNTASAMTCLGAAMDKDSTAVADFIAQQQGDDQSMLIMVRTLVGRTQLSDFKDEPVELNNDTI